MIIRTSQFFEEKENALVTLEVAEISEDTEIPPKRKKIINLTLWKLKTSLKRHN